MTTWRHFLILTIICFTFAFTMSADTVECNEAGLDAAIAVGGVQHLNCTEPTTITVSDTKTVTNTLTLRGNGLLTLSGGDLRQIMYVDGGDLTLNNVELRDGVSLNGGAIYNTGTLTLVNTLIASNQSTGTDTLNGGGAIYNSGGTLNIHNSVISENVAANDGGAILNGLGTINIDYSTIENNQSADDGGGIWNESGTVTISHSTLSSNQSVQDGGAIFNRSAFGTATVNILNSTLSGNQATGASGDGGAIYTTSRAGTTVNLNIDYATIINNTASDMGDGIFNWQNGGGTSTTTINNSIILNATGGDCVAQDGAMFTGITNADSDGTSCPDSSSMSIGTHISKSLADNGGVTQTHALIDIVSNPAIDQSDDCGLSDQRGVGRDSNCDFGAYEQSVTPFDTPLIDFAALSINEADGDGALLEFDVPAGVSIVEDIDVIWTDLGTGTASDVDDYSTGTAPVIFDCDGTACTGTLQSSELLTVMDDNEVEVDEFIVLVLVSVKGPATLPISVQQTATIIDDDTQAYVSINERMLRQAMIDQDINVILVDVQSPNRIVVTLSIDNDVGTVDLVLLDGDVPAFRYQDIVLADGTEPSSSFSNTIHITLPSAFVLALDSLLGNQVID